MRETVIDRLRKLFGLYSDLATALPEDALVQKLPTPSNTIGAQFWCLIGARESYTRALGEGGWSGFACSLSAEDIQSNRQILQALAESVRLFDETVTDLEWTAERDELLLALLEHEAQHQGQFIRYVYGLRLDFPKSWSERWALGT